MTPVDNLLNAVRLLKDSEVADINGDSLKALNLAAKASVAVALWAADLGEEVKRQMPDTGITS